jgi:hypothetical protein
MSRLDLWRAVPLSTCLDLIVEDQDIVSGIIIHAVLRGQEKLTAVSLRIVDECSGTHPSSVLSQQHSD